MLNPSTADETANDPTVARCIKTSQKWGYGGCVVTNIFAIRATDPEDMKRAKDPIGADNNSAILGTAFNAGLILCAWGAHGRHMRRSAYVAGMLNGAGIKLHCLKLTAEGEPGHPLYLPGDLEPRIFEPPLWMPGDE